MSQGTGLWVPPEELQRQRAAEAEKLAALLAKQGATCPYATIGQYADSDRHYIRCAAEDSHFAIADSPTAAIAWCCGDPTDGCPSFLSAKTGDGAVERNRHARERGHTERINQRHRDLGIRVDDGNEG
jgi:hypothetical protein